MSKKVISILIFSVCIGLFATAKPVYAQIPQMIGTVKDQNGNPVSNMSVCSTGFEQISFGNCVMTAADGSYAFSPGFVNSLYLLFQGNLRVLSPNNPAPAGGQNFIIQSTGEPAPTADISATGVGAHTGSGWNGEIAGIVVLPKTSAITVSWSGSSANTCYPNWTIQYVNRSTGIPQYLNGLSSGSWPRWPTGLSAAGSLTLSPAEMDSVDPENWGSNTYSSVYWFGVTCIGQTGVSNAEVHVQRFNTPAQTPVPTASPIPTSTPSCTSTCTPGFCASSNQACMLAADGCYYPQACPARQTCANNTCNGTPPPSPTVPPLLPPPASAVCFDVARLLTLNGNFIAKGGFKLYRDLGEPQNRTIPAEVFVERPDFWITINRDTFPALIRDVLVIPNYNWQEVTP